MDELTGLPSRQEIPALLDDPQPAVWLDVDYLRGLTDAQGWQVVDDTLRRLAKWLAEKAASLGGAAVRVGGDEFLIVLPGGSVEAARAEADRLVAECQTLGLPYANPGTDRTTFAMSAVVSIVDARSFENPIAFRERMEGVVYRAKQRLGRNFGVVAEERDFAE